MKVDSIMVSAMWGRVGAAILMFVSIGLNAIGFEFTSEDQGAANTIIVSVIGLAGAGMALVSKIRETKRIE